MAASVYIHIPFCRHICSYCDFPKFYYFEKWIKPYLNALQIEIESHYQKEKIKTIYIGGGTPTVLSDEDFEFLLKLTTLFKVDSKLEFTVEANSEDITLKKAKILKKYGVNRVSMGVQTFHEKLGDVLERHTSYETVKKAIALLNEVGIDNINVDLMYAIPKETMDELKEDLEKIIHLPVTHVSTYSLILEEHTKLYLQKPVLLEEDLDSEMYYEILNTLKKHGFHHYEISNYAKEGFFCRHNLGYWNNEEYYGFGLGASGYLNSIRKTNTSSLTAYLRGNFKETREIIDDGLNMEYEMILGFRKREGVSISHFYQKFHKDVFKVFPVISHLLKENLLQRFDDNLQVVEDKLYLMNEILIHFVDVDKKE